VARGDPIDGQILLLASAKAGVGTRLPDLVDDAQTYVAERAADYRRRHETFLSTADYDVLLVDPDHWERVGDALGFDARERDAVRRAHEEQARRAATRADRADEFETALDLRQAVVLGTAADP
jgi:hypothetical protein